MKYLFSGLTLILILAACQQKADDPLYTEVMDIHDNVMPRMSEISKLSMELRTRKKSLQDSALISNYDQRIEALNEAENAMFDWMNDFKLPEEKEKRKAYLEDEKVKIQRVRNLMINSIDNAQKILQTE